MTDLLGLLERKRDQLTQAEKLQDILDRPSVDFHTYQKPDGSLGSMMRPAPLPLWVWQVWVWAVKFRRPLAFWNTK